VRPTYEYWGQLDPTHEVNYKVPRDEIAARVMQMYTGWIGNKKCPKAHSLTRHTDPVSPEQPSRFDVFLYVRGRPLMSHCLFFFADSGAVVLVSDTIVNLRGATSEAKVEGLPTSSSCATGKL
jgi:hypothetical protein